MSKFFRSVESLGSSSEDSESEESSSAHSVAPLDVSRSNAVDVDHSTGVPSGRSGNASFHRDMLLHALLEERCKHAVVEEARPGVDVDREAHVRYQSLCRRLAPLNLVSTGLEDDLHQATRQRYRSGLDLLSRSGLSSDANPAYLPPTLKRLLTEGDTQALIPSWQALQIKQQSGVALLELGSLTPSRYLQDFDEISLLGKGGYGSVYSAKHRLDGCTYAVKKVRIHPSIIARISSAAEFDGLLAEVRALSKLAHPNVVRYFSSWMEWSSSNSAGANSSNGDFGNDSWSEDAVAGAEKDQTEESMSRVFTQSDSLGAKTTSGADLGLAKNVSSGEGIGFTFESRSTLDKSGMTSSHSMPATRRSDRDPALELYMQMDVYPMTLADYLSPKAEDEDVGSPAHCFHLEPSIRIMLALLDGVEYLHSQNIVHRDLKPANIFLGLEKDPRSRRGSVDLLLCSNCRSNGKACPTSLDVRIGDFGLVAQIADPGQLTLPPKPVGTEIYRPTATGGHVSPSLDIFALGVIACELLCKFETQMERRETLQDLKFGKLPEHFASCAGMHSNRLRDCVMSMLSSESGSTDIVSLKQDLACVIQTA